MMKYRVKNWTKFQHYNNRNPPWIKFYSECIEDFKSDGSENEFHKLSDCAKLTLMLLWLLASKFKGIIPSSDENWLKHRLGISRIEIAPLVSAGFIESYEDDSNSASTPASNVGTANLKCPSVSDSDSDSESSSSEPPASPPVPEGSKNPKFQKPTAAEVGAYARSIGFDLNVESWLAHYISNGWKVGKVPMKDWKGAVRTWKHNKKGGNNGSDADRRRSEKAGKEFAEHITVPKL